MFQPGGFRACLSLKPGTTVTRKMRILVLTKRYNMGRDSVKDRHGRMFAIPNAMEVLGHEVRVIYADYHPKRSADEPAVDLQPGWRIVDASRGPLPAFGKYLATVRAIVESWRPDVIWAGSDALHVIFGSRLSMRYGIPCVADLKDNYESFGVTRIPMVGYLYRKSLKKVDGVSCVSAPLCKYVMDSRAVRETCIVENAVPGDIFSPTDKRIARRHFNLPDDRTLVGTAGALVRGRGIAALSRAFERVSVDFPNTMLVVAGQRDRGWTPPGRGDHVDLGILSPEEIPVLFSALDLGVVCSLNTAFGRYCYPQKYTEMIACRLPVLAARAGVFETNGNLPGVVEVFNPGDAVDLASKLGAWLSKPPGRLADIPVPDWNDRATVLTQYFENIVNRSAGRRV